MSIETRHTEKNVLFNLLLLSAGVHDVDQAITQLTATMEPEDVELVEKKFNEFMARFKAKGSK